MMDQQLPEQPAAPETPAAPVQASGVIPLTPEQVTYWRGEITRSRAKRKEVIERYGWDDNLKRYEPPKPKEGSEINLGVDFADVERKKAALLFDTPSVALQTHMEDRLQAVALHQQLLNTLLGPQHIDFQPTALQALFNCLCPSGVGPVVIG